jgi:phosphatidate cytidylyltransferase
MAGGEAGKSDLPVRAASAMVMLAVTGTALWLGGLIWTVFVAAVALGVLWEWTRLYLAVTSSLVGRAAWAIAGALYVGLALATLAGLRASDSGLFAVCAVVLTVVAVDVGAYFAGRAIGGPKIAPAISPSKTWAGLAGGIVGAVAVIGAGLYLQRGSLPCNLNAANCHSNAALWLMALPAGALLAIVAQCGDFFESWMKRRAGVKDSSRLIPGHGGLFDRVDGLLAVLFVIGLISAIRL